MGNPVPVLSQAQAGKGVVAVQVGSWACTCWVARSLGRQRQAIVWGRQAASIYEGRSGRHGSGKQKQITKAGRAHMGNKVEGEGRHKVQRW